MSLQDPFTQVLKDTKEQTAQLLQYLEGNAPNDEIYEILTDVEETIKDLDSSIIVMRREGNLNDSEIINREGQLDDLKRQVATMKKKLSDNTAISRNEADLRDEPQEEGVADSRNNLLQQQMIQEQDTHLDTIHQTMQSLHLQASTMGQELEDQGLMLDEMDQGMDGVMGKLSRGRRQLEWVYEKNKEKYNDCCIGLLIAVLIVLLVLAFVL